MTCQVGIGEFFIVEWIIFIYLFVEEKGSENAVIGALIHRDQ